MRKTATKRDKRKKDTKSELKVLAVQQTTPDKPTIVTNWDKTSNERVNSPNNGDSRTTATPKAPKQGMEKDATMPTRRAGKITKSPEIKGSIGH